MSLFYKLRRGVRLAWAFGASLIELFVRRPATRPARAAWLSGLCRRILRSVDIRYSSSGPIPLHGGVISNHLTYVDILIHSALRPCVFVSAIEVRKIPLFGWMSMMAGTVYVTRGAGGSAAKAADGMAAGFHDGLPVVFFPEGGTSVGDEPLMPLHSGLLATALKSGAPVTAGFVRYALAPEDVVAGHSARNDVHWGKQTLPAHLWNFLGLRTVHAHIDFAPGPIDFTPEALTDRKLAARQARTAILALTGNQGGDTTLVRQK